MLDTPATRRPGRRLPPPRRRAARGRVLALALLLAAMAATAALASFTRTSTASQTVATSSCFYIPTVQSGSTTSTANGTKTVTITAVTMSHAFLLFSMRSDSNRPVGSEVAGRIASTTSLEFIRVTDAVAPEPVTITIQWYVVDYPCGVTVQRGSLSQGAATVDVTITAVSALSQAFVTWSKTPYSSDQQWGDNDGDVGELTTTSNLEFRSDNVNVAAPHTIYWQVVEFTDSTKVNVQKGTTSLTGAATSTTVTLGTAVTTSRSFLLVAARATGPGTDISSGMVRGRLTSSTQITLDRSTANFDATEITWQVVELKDGSKVQSGTAPFAASASAAGNSLTAVDLTRVTAFAAGQSAGGQSGGRTSYTADDVVGDTFGTVVVTSTTNVTVTRANTAGAADIPWFVVEWGRPSTTSNHQ